MYKLPATTHKFLGKDSKLSVVEIILEKSQLGSQNTAMITFTFLLPKSLFHLGCI